MDFTETVNWFAEHLRVSESFDLRQRFSLVADRRVCLFFVDGFVQSEALEKQLTAFLGAEAEKLRGVDRAETFIDRFITHAQASVCVSREEGLRRVLAGSTLMVVEGLESCILVDARGYPTREVGEPETDRVMRGSRDGFVEPLMQNAALIRRRLREPSLTFEMLPVGTVSSTEVCLCYMVDRVDEQSLARLRKKITSITVPALSMGQESLAECILPRQWYNPFPRIRYSERPDAAAACIAEGQIVVLVDNSPAAMLMPTSIFAFSQDTNDYYFPPIVGSYLRLVRGLIFTSTMFITPLWYWLVKNPESIPKSLSFMRIKETIAIPLFVQLLLVEVLIDALKLASLNTPTSLSNALSLVGALLFGEFAVNAGLFVPELLAYMAFVSIATFTQPSRELTYAFKLCRLFLLLLVRLLDGWGLLLGGVILAVLLLTTRTPTGGGYLFPVIPFHGRALCRLLLRQPIRADNAAKPPESN